MRKTYFNVIEIQSLQNILTAIATVVIFIPSRVIYPAACSGVVHYMDFSKFVKCEYSGSKWSVVRP